MKEETISKMIDFNPTIQIITLKENGQNKLNKNQILSLKEEIKKDVNIC